MGGIGTLYDELLPIFCSEDLEHGGLGMTSGQIGQILMVCGCALMLFQMFGYSRLSKALGPLRLLRLACWGHVIMMLLPAFGTTVRPSTHLVLVYYCYYQLPYFQFPARDELGMCIFGNSMSDVTVQQQ